MKWCEFAPEKRVPTRSDQANKRGGTMMTIKLDRLLIALGLWASLFAAPVSAQEKASEPAAPPAVATPTPAAATAPKLTTYFTATSDDPKKPSAWPDQTGGAAGTWATPAADAK